jgi:glutamine amidotransferase
VCRFVLYRGEPIHLASLITTPENSLIHQSFDSREREEPLNGDGFGVAWYAAEADPDAALFRSITPAWNNQNLRHLARVTKSHCVLAHVRAASDGMAVTELNTHPFVHGPYAFMHNGELAGFRHHRRALMNDLDERHFELVAGTTDSECLFAHVLQRLAHDRLARASDMADALSGAMGHCVGYLAGRGVRGVSTVNAVLANGREAVACRYTSAADREAPSLHLHTGKLYSCRSGTPELVEAHEDEHSVIVASEPLTGDASWQVVPNNHLVAIDARRRVSLRPIPALGKGGSIA